MCAISGCLGKNESLVARMNAASKQRGPDSTHVWSDDGVTLGFNRLAIIDLSDAAMQPMQDATGRYRIVFNGEIYNYKELKRELAGYPFKTESDTEVILAAFARWGMTAFERLNGMFDLALWDAQEKTLILARDPSGIKPLYYYSLGSALYFASDMRSLLEAPIDRMINKTALAHYLRLMYVPKGMSMIEGVQKLLPGHTLVARGGAITVQPFATWPAADVPVTYAEGVHAVQASVTAAITRQLVSDRPVGLYLSGGIDSSIIAAVAAKAHPKINSYSVGFDLNDGEDTEKFNADVDLARQTAAFFGTTHHEYRITATEALGLLDEAVAHMSDPVGNATALAQVYLAKRCKETATVVLTGDGGDELFGGYERYRLAHLADRYARYIPKGFESLLPKVVRRGLLKGVERYAQLMFQNSAGILPEFKDLPIYETKALFANEFAHAGDIADQLMRTDEHNWLVDEALLRADGMSMAGSVEARVPFLDAEVISLAHVLPREWKVTTGATKRILKDAFKMQLPGFVLAQPKRGWFSPGAKWLRRPEFIARADEVFRPDFTECAALFDMQHVRQLWDLHKSKKAYHYTELWAVLTFLLWAREYKVRI